MNGENGESKPSEKEQIDEKSKGQVETPKILALPVSSINGFNTEEFLARVNMNEKINNILRSPRKTPNGVRQRSVFTAITPSSVSFGFKHPTNIPHFTNSFCPKAKGCYSQIYSLSIPLRKLNS